MEKIEGNQMGLILALRISSMSAKSLSPSPEHLTAARANPVLPWIFTDDMGDSSILSKPGGLAMSHDEHNKGIPLLGGVHLAGRIGADLYGGSCGIEM